MTSKSCILLIALLGILLIEDSSCQSITWQRTYDVSSGRELGSDICKGPNGSFYITGYYDNFPEKIIVLRINPYGDTIWTRLINSVYEERGLAIAPSTDGGCVVTGQSDSSYALKLDSNGSIVWKKYYGYGGCYDIKKTSDGGYVACGIVLDIVSRGYVYRIDSEGNLLWQFDYPMGYRNTLYSIVETSDTGYIATGGISNTPNDAGVFVLKLHNNGNVNWFKEYRIENKLCFGVNIKELNSQFLIAGSFVADSTFRQNILMSRINIKGDTVFNKLFHRNVPESNLGLDIINNNRYVLSMTRDSIGFNSKAVIVDSMGIILNDRVFFGESYLTTNSILCVPNGDILFAGTYEYRSAPFYTIYCVRTDSNLNYPPLIPVEKIQSEIPAAFKLQQNYPNPFNPITQIKFELARNTYVWIEVYNTLGELVETLVNNEYKTAGVYSVAFDGTNFASGIYFYTLETTEYRESKKMVLIR